MTRIGTLVTKSMTVLDSTDENRFFEGYLTVEMKDKQGEITVVDELYKVLPIWVDRGAPITDTHSNRVIGKGINFAKTTVEDGGVTYPAIKITGKIHKNYELDTDIWEKIKSGEYKGLSFGGATKANRVPKVMKDGDVAYALTDLEHYEVAVCKDPAVPLALITEFNSVAKAAVPSEPRGDGKEVIKCNKWGCYVTKSEGKDEPEYHDESLIKGQDWSNADITTATVTNTVSQSTQTAKPIKTDKKVGVPENEGGLKINVTPLEGGIADNQYKKNDTPASTGVGGGVRAHIDDASNQDNPKDQTAQVSEKIEEIHKKDIKYGQYCTSCGQKKPPTKRVGAGGSSPSFLIPDDSKSTCPDCDKNSDKHKANINKIVGAILAGAQRVKSSQSFASGSPSPKKPKGTVTAFGDDDKKDKPKKDNWNNKPEGEAPNWKTPKGDKGKPERAKDKPEDHTKMPKPKKKEPFLSNSWEALRQEWKSIIEKKDAWDKKDREGLTREHMQRAVHAANTYANEEAGYLGSKQHKDEDRAVRSGKVTPSRTVTVSGDAKIEKPKHEVAIDLLHELKALSESTKSALGALGWGKLNRDGSKQKLRKKQPKLDDFIDEKKSGYQTEYGNNQLGGQAVPTEKEKLTSSLGAQNKQRKVTIRTER